MEDLTIQIRFYVPEGFGAGLVTVVLSRRNVRIIRKIAYSSSSMYLDFIFIPFFLLIVSPQLSRPD